jgi:patatin-like phospholipase/acyl hydrolase
MSSITDRLNLLSKVIAQRTELLEKMKDDFNRHTREANSLQFRCEKLAVEIMKDNQSLEEIKRELEEAPTLHRQKEIA